METIDNEMSNESGVKFTSQIKNKLIEIAKWGNLIAIIWFIILGLITISAFSMLFRTVVTDSRAGVNFTIGFIQILMAGLYFFPAYFLFLFARKIKVGLNSLIQSEVDLAFNNLKKLFKFIGIIMVIMFSSYVLILLYILLSIIGGVGNGF